LSLVFLQFVSDNELYKPKHVAHMAVNVARYFGCDWRVLLNANLG